jgi:2-polyprenyl-3-methyl-5-hydroxy-6-metoxy-1,4-benzoquinol methylase
MNEKTIQNTSEEISSCPFCRKKGEKLLFLLRDTDENEREVCRCLGCRLIYVKGQTDFNGFLLANAGLHEKGFKKVFNTKKEKLVCDFILKNIEPGLILDVECKTGSIIKNLKENGYGVIGINSDMSLFDKVLLENDIYEYNFLNFWHYDNEFDAVLFIDVLNYSRNPREYLEKASGFVKPGGYIVLQENILLSRLSQRFDENYAGYDLSKSGYFFNPKTIKTILRDMGFKEKKIKKYYPTGFFDHVKSFIKMINKKKFFKNPLIKSVAVFPIVLLSPLINIYYFLSNHKRYRVFGNTYLAVYKKIS